MTDARTFAANAHRGQTYGDGPYTVHLAEVVEIVRTVDDSEEAQAGAWLHDVVEDTPVTVADLKTHFGYMVALVVYLVTDPTGHNRRERKAALNANLRALDTARTSNRIALVVKAADRLANVRACVAAGDSRLKMYQREHAAFREATYREDLCAALWEELDALLGD